MDIALDEVIHFDAVTHHPTTGAVTDADSTPTWSIFEEDTDTAILAAQNFTKRTSLTGNYRGSATLSTANGFEVGKWYNVVASATVNSIAGKGVLMRFRVAAAEGIAGYPKVDQHALRGDAQSATDLKDFADDGYDPSTNKVQGVLLTDTLTTYTGNTPQTGDSFARIGVTGSGLTSLASNADMATLLGRLTAARAGYLDFLNIGGPAASQADIIAINQSASRRVILTTVGQYERPESGSTVYTIEMRTYDGDGAAVDADSTPTLTGTGTTSGSLAANIGTVSNPSTGLYRWDYTVASDATIEPVRFEVSPTISGSQFPMACYTQVVNLVAATWTTSDAANLTAIFNKLPTGDIADQDTLAALVTTVGAAGAGLTESGGTGDHLTAIPWNAAWDSEVQSEMQDAIEANHLDHLLAVAYDPASKPGAADALLNELIGNDSGVAQFTANALELAPSGGGGGSDPLLNAVPGAYAAGTAGYRLGYLDAFISALVGLTGTVAEYNIPNGGLLTLKHDDDYYEADGRLVTFTAVVPGTWDGGTAADCSIRLQSGAVVVDVVAKYVTQAASVLTMSFEFPAASFTSLPVGKPGNSRQWEILIELTGSHTVTPIKGSLEITPAIPAP